MTSSHHRADWLTETERLSLKSRGLRLAWFSIAYNVVEAIVAVSAGLIADSVALVGFGIDSGIEVTSALAARWRLSHEMDQERRARAEGISRKVIGWCFLVLTIYVTAESVPALMGREEPRESPVGLALLAASVVVMPLLARAKRSVAARLSSRALRSDARQTSLCAYLSLIALAGVGANMLAGWWWADPVAALVMVPIIGIEAVQGIRSRG